MCVVNSKLIEMFSIKNNFEIEGGKAEVDENGELNGIFRESAMNYVLEKIAPLMTNKENRKKWIKMGQEYCLKNGITSVQTSNNYSFYIFFIFFNIFILFFILFILFLLFFFIIYIYIYILFLF